MALVTGASSGIGAATARRLAAAGATVALAARRRQRLERLAAELEATGALAVELDVSDRDSVDAGLQATVKALGRLDLLVNNAGVMLLGPTREAKVSEWAQMVEANLLGALHCTAAALPHLLAAADDGRGVADLVNVSSVAGRFVRPDNAVYAATKHGIGAFSESLRQELSGRGLRVALVEPGAVDTELASHNRPEVRARLARRYREIVPLAADDVADAILYAVTRPARVAVNEILLRSSAQP